MYNVGYGCDTGGVSSRYRDSKMRQEKKEDLYLNTPAFKWFFTTTAKRHP